MGIAMGSGTDVARESANVVLLGNDLSKFVETLRIARRAHGIIRFNFVGTLVVDAVGVGIAAFSLLNPLIAAFIHVASELTFILNSARLLPSATAAALSRNVVTGRTNSAASFSIDGRCPQSSNLASFATGLPRRARLTP